MRIVEFTQTPFITHDDRMMLRLRVTDWDYCNPFHVRICSNGIELCSASMFIDHFSLLIPVPESDSECTVTLTPFEDIPVISIHRLTVPKHWRIGILYSSHEDIGYCAWANKLEYESYLYLKDAMRLCREHDGFRYMIEHVWWLHAFERYANEEEQAELKRLFHEKRIELNAIHCGYHTHWAEGEQLIRAMHFGTVEAAEKWQIRPTAAIFTDISGMSWQSVPAYAGQGIRFAGILENGGFRKPSVTHNPPPVFRWRAQNGRDSLLCWYQHGYRGGLGGIWCDTNRLYPEGSYIFDETKALKTEQYFTDVLVPLSEEPYDIYPLSFYTDREKPTTMLLTICEYMNRKWKYPHFSMELPSAMLDEIDRQGGDSLPELTGDINDQWGDFAAISPEWMSIKRRAMRELLPAEMLAVLAAMNGAEYDYTAFREMVRYGCLYDEHCWATSSKHPQKMHLFNMAYTKKRSAEKALEIAEKQIAGLLGTPDKQIGLYNLLPQARRHPLRLPTDTIPDGVALQQVGDFIITEPLSFDASETKVFPHRSRPIPDAIPAPNRFETEFYEVTADLTTHTVTSIVEKTTRRELIDRTAPYTLGEYVYTIAADKNDYRLSFEIPKRRKFTIEEGDVAYVIHREGYEEQSGADVYSDFIFYKHSPQIDLELRFEYATGLMGDYSDRYRKSIFFALPLMVKHPSFYTQLAGGSAHRTDEKIPVCPQDFTVVEDWLAVEGDDGGIGIRSEDMPVFHLSQINYNRFLTEPHFPHSHVYLYAASNRTNNLNLRTPEACHGRYHLSLLPYSGHCEDLLPQWNRCLSQPVLVGDGRKVGGISIDSELRLMSMRAFDEHSVLIRFSEEHGVSIDAAKLTLPFKPIGAFLTTLDGKELTKAEIDGFNVVFPVRARDYVTLKIQGSFTIQPHKAPMPPVFNIFSVDVENKRSIVCFEKAEGLKASGFRLIGDGKILAEIPNRPEAVQTCELDCRPAAIEIRIL